MTEKIQIKGQDIWIVVEPHITHMSDVQPKEYFTASFHSVDPATEPGGNIFLDDQHKPIVFNSPVEALEYASEKLLAAY